MTTKAIKSNIYKALENIEDAKFLKAVFEIVFASKNTVLKLIIQAMNILLMSRYIPNTIWQI